MSKRQKIWLGIFGAMFLVPEILWSPMIDFYYQLILQSNSSGIVPPLRQNFLTNSDNISILKFVISMQLLGLSLFLIRFLSLKIKNKIIKIIAISFLTVLLFLTAFFVLFAFNFNPQIG